MQEIYALIELLTMLVAEPRTATLFILLSIASVSDYRTYKIPNWLTAGGIIFGLIYNSIVPIAFHQGFASAVQGMLLGFLIMLPFYALKVMGAGDVKLMAMVGALLGLSDTLNAALYSLITGGVAAVLFSIVNNRLTHMLINVKDITQLTMLSIAGGFKPDVQITPEKSVGKLPFGICISIGTIIYVVAKQIGIALVI
jgi:prepilin peptidase CpaA